MSGVDRNFADGEVDDGSARLAERKSESGTRVSSTSAGGLKLILPSSLSTPTVDPQSSDSKKAVSPRNLSVKRRFSDVASKARGSKAPAVSGEAQGGDLKRRRSRTTLDDQCGKCTSNDKDDINDGSAKMTREDNDDNSGSTARKTKIGDSAEAQEDPTRSRTTSSRSDETVLKEKDDDEESKSSKKIQMKRGRWAREEHKQFLKGLQLYGKQWTLISDMIPSRTPVQIRSHAQKYFSKLRKKESLQRKRQELLARSSLPSYPYLIPRTSPYVMPLGLNMHLPGGMNQLAPVMYPYSPGQPIIPHLHYAELDRVGHPQSSRNHNDVVMPSSNAYYYPPLSTPMTSDRTAPLSFVPYPRIEYGSSHHSSVAPSSSAGSRSQLLHYDGNSPFLDRLPSADAPTAGLSPLSSAASSNDPTLEGKSANAPGGGVM